MPQEFTNNWFAATAQWNWDQLLPELQPQRILEIGSYEGASTCYCINRLAPLVEDLEIHCIDTWEGSIEHQQGGILEADMSEVEKRFINNTNIEIENASCNVKLVRHKETSLTALSKLIAEGKLSYFDFAYVDGSHQAPDVLSDATLTFHLLRVGGVIAFDDYLWSEDSVIHRDPIRCPKMAIDMFTNIFFRKVKIITDVPIYQLYVQKVSQ